VKHATSVIDTARLVLVLRFATVDLRWKRWAVVCLAPPKEGV
jgi:hypothetical protein